MFLSVILKTLKYLLYSFTTINILYNFIFLLQLSVFGLGATANDRNDRSFENQNGGSSRG